jgi:hypothetical protein
MVPFLVEELGLRGGNLQTPKKAKKPYDDLANRRFQPLTHLSKAGILAKLDGCLRT